MFGVQPSLQDTYIERKGLEIVRDDQVIVYSFHALQLNQTGYNIKQAVLLMLLGEYFCEALILQAESWDMNYG